MKRHNSKLKILSTIFFVSMLLSARAQQLSKSRLDSINLHVIGFLKGMGYLDKRLSDVDCLSRIYILELTDNKSIGIRDFGIYVCGAMRSHTRAFFLTLTPNEWKIETGDFKGALLDIMLLLTQNQISDSETFKYVKNAVAVEEENRINFHSKD